MILTTVKIEDAPEKIREPLGLLTGEAQDLYCAWQIFSDITVDVPETIALINKTSPLFFKRIQSILFEHLIIGVARFTDPPSQFGHRNLSLHDLFDGQKPAQLAELDTTAGNIREIRRKIVGHLNYKCGIDPSSLPNKGIISEIRKSLELIERIIEVAWDKWTGSVYSISSMGSSATVEILNCLQKTEVYDRLEKKSRAGRFVELSRRYDSKFYWRFASRSEKLLTIMSQLANQIAVVTGAGRGIGRAIALKFAAEGADVVCVSRTQENSEKVAAEIRALGRKAWAFAVDVADSAAVAAAAEKILAEAGKVDILVNNAGVTRDGLVMRMSDADWDTVLDTNLKGAFLFTKAFSRAFAKQRSGRIINISSVIGLIGNPGQSNYAASKAGLFGFTQSVAREFASRGITANCIAPGFIETDMTSELNEELKAAILKQIPMGKFGAAEDIANAALFLAGASARYITGQVLTVDGGMVM